MKLFNIKREYAIPSENGLDITKGKKYRLYRDSLDYLYIKDNSKTKIFIKQYFCLHLNGGSWEIIKE